MMMIHVGRLRCNLQQVDAAASILLIMITMLTRMLLLLLLVLLTNDKGWPWQLGHRHLTSSSTTTTVVARV